MQKINFSFVWCCRSTSSYSLYSQRITNFVFVSLRRTSTCICVCKRTSTCLCVCRITSTCICVLEEHRLVSVFVFAEREFESGVSLHIRSISLSANSNATVLLANWTLPAEWEAMQMDINRNYITISISNAPALHWLLICFNRWISVQIILFRCTYIRNSLSSPLLLEILRCIGPLVHWTWTRRMNINTNTDKIA